MTFAPLKTNTNSTVAQMAEQVDALVSKTSGSFPIPVRFRFWVF